MRSHPSTASPAPFAYFLFASTLALIIGLVVANVVRPGEGLNVDPATLDAARVASYTGTASRATLAEFLLGIVPSSFLGALAGGELLPVLFLSIVFGAARSRSARRPGP